jgi:hypothetical protein
MSGTGGRLPIGSADTVEPGRVRLPALIEATSGAPRRWAVELRIVAAGAGPAGALRASAALGLPATVVAGAATGALALDLGPGRALLPPGLVDLPEGAVVAVQLVPPDGGVPIVDRPGLDRLLARLARAAAAAGSDIDDQPAAAASREHPRMAVDATLGARLLAEWRALGQRGAGDRRPAATADGGVRGGGAAPELEPQAAQQGERDGAWRTQSALLAAAGSPPMPLILWRRHAMDQAELAADAHLRLTLELTRLGSVVIELRVAPSRLEIMIRTPLPLPDALRAALGQAVAAAAALAGRAMWLSFRSAAQPAAEQQPLEAPR